MKYVEVYKKVDTWIVRDKTTGKVIYQGKLENIAKEKADDLEETKRLLRMEAEQNELF